MKQSIVVMGVAGCGKSTLAAMLCERSGARMIEGDDHHSDVSRRKMQEGIALNDADRSDWLDRLGVLAQQTEGHVVITCSALKRAYRDRLRRALPGLRFVHVDIDKAEALRRVARRGEDHFFPASLVEDQFKTLEPPHGEPDVLVVNGIRPLSDLVAKTLTWMGWPHRENTLNQDMMTCIAIVGLGKMGGNMVRRLRRRGIDVIGFDRDRETVKRLTAECGMLPASSVPDTARQLAARGGVRAFWLMLPCGDPTEQTLLELAELASAGDILIDGGNSNYKDSQRRSAFLQERGIDFIDVGTSGGVWGLENGYCLMIGGAEHAVSRLGLVFRALAPDGDLGWAHVGPVGAGHYAKMLHNGIEYGMMQALAEGLDLLKHKQEFGYDLAQLTALWQHGSVIRSWLLDLTAEALAKDQELHDIVPSVPDSGEGRWTAIDAIEQGIAAPVLTLALQARFASRDELGYSSRLLSIMRNAFGGHAVEKK